jgi:hypothetical protein
VISGHPDVLLFLGLGSSRERGGASEFHAIASSRLGSIKSYVSLMKKFFHRAEAPLLTQQ